MPPRVLVITDWRLPRERLLAALERALEVGPQVAVQHRHPEAPARQFLEEARVLAGLCRARGNPLFVNGRLDVALLVGAHLHLPAAGLRPEDVRRHLPPGRWVSVAVHDEQEARRAQGADLALVSPVFPPGSKPEDTRPTLGPEGFRRLAEALPCPGARRPHAGAGRAAHGGGRLRGHLRGAGGRGSGRRHAGPVRRGPRPLNLARWRSSRWCSWRPRPGPRGLSCNRTSR